MHRKILALLMVLAAFTGNVHGMTLELSTSDAPPYSTPAGSGLADRTVMEAFRRIGVSTKILTAPSERSLVNANLGIVDGEYLRIAGIEKMYPNLVMVPEPVCENEFTAFARDPAIKLRGWESLGPYSVGFITGWKLLEENVTKVRSLTKVKDDKALFDLLTNDRVDIVIFDRRRGEAHLKHSRERGVRPLTPPLARRPMYLYVNRKHSALVSPLAEALRQMKRDGASSRIMTSVLGVAD